MPEQLTVQQFAQRIRAKYPGAYDSLSDADLTQKVVAKYPQYQSSILPDQPAQIQQPGASDYIGEGALGFSEGYGLPTSSSGTENLKTVAQQFNPQPQTTAEKIAMLAGPAGPVAVRMLRGNWEQAQKAFQAAKEGTAPALKEAAIRGAGALVPVIGPAAVETGEAIGSAPDSLAKTRAIMRGVGLVTSLGLGTKRGQAAAERTTQAITKGAETTGQLAKTGTQAARSLVDPTMITADNAFIKGVKPRNTIPNVREKVNIALPEMKRVAQESGIDFSQIPDEQLHSVADDLAKQAAQQKWEQIAQRLEANGTRTVSTEGISEAIANRVAKMTDIGKRENRGAVIRALQKAKDYAGGQIDVSRMEARIQELNNKLRGQQSQLKVNEATLRNDPKYMADFIELDSLRKMQDGILEAHGSSVRQLKREYGALKEVRGMIERNANVAERASAQPLFEGLGRMAGTGNMVGGAYQVLTSPFAGTEAAGAAMQGLANIAKGGVQMAIGRKASLLNNRNFMLRQSLMKANPATKMADFVQPEVMAPPQQVSPRQPLALPPGQYEMPSSSLSESAAQQLPPPQIVQPNSRAAELQRLMAENRDVLATPLMSEGSLSPTQLGMMSKKQVAAYQAKVRRRFAIEDQIKELSKSDEQVARETAETQRQNVAAERERLLRNAQQLEDLAARGMKPKKYRAEAAKLRAQAETLK